VLEGAEPADAARGRSWIVAYMNALKRVQRFETLVMFMSASEKATVREVLAILKEGGVEIDGWRV
jgi:hypothetical protein